MGHAPCHEKPYLLPANLPCINDFQERKGERWWKVEMTTCAYGTILQQLEYGDLFLKYFFLYLMQYPLSPPIR